MTIVEGLACGTPMLVSRLGACQELLREGETGFFFDAGSSESLAAKVQLAWHSKSHLEQVSRRARAEYEAKYTGRRNYARLIEILAKLGVDTEQRVDPPNLQFSEIRARG